MFHLASLIRPIVLGALLTLLLGDCALARQNIRSAFFEVYPEAETTQLIQLPSNADHCGVCHFDFNGGGPRNPYGGLLEVALEDFPNNPNGRRQAVQSIESEDAEFDGYTTWIEVTDLTTYVNTPTFPGLFAGNVGQVSGVDSGDLTFYLTPVGELDTESPVVEVLSPDGGEVWFAGDPHTIAWTATDDVDVVAIDVDYRDGALEAWIPLARGMADSGELDWFVHNTPTPDALVRVTAYDAAGNFGSDVSGAFFEILSQPGGLAPTTLRDFKEPGSQPFDAGDFSGREACQACHAGYDEGAEPDHPFGGSMMAQAARDPIFYACLTIAEQDAPSSGDLCLRCHTPFGWLDGRSNPTDGSMLTRFDREGVSCEFCHRMVDPVHTPGEDPVEDEAVLDVLVLVPETYANGQFVADPLARRRGPYADAVAPHAFLESSFHRSSEFCGTCHDVSNPVFERVDGADYAPGPVDEMAADFHSSVLLPLERTYSEWANSDYAHAPGVYAPEFAGNKPDGYVSTCQDCHMPDVLGYGCNDPGAPERADLPFHDLTGGSYWLPTVLDEVYPTEVDPIELGDGAGRAASMLRRAASLSIEIEDHGDELEAIVTVTNRTGHKLPTGYPEGRRAWIHLEAFDSEGAQVYESGAYDNATGVLTEDEDARIYEAKMGLSESWAAALGLPSGPSFHFALNDTLYQDNRIPPLGFTNAEFALFGGEPVDPHWEGPGPRYEDGQNWDTATYDLPREARLVVATLYYQSTSKEYIEFLRDENHTDETGNELYQLWSENGRAAPLAMVVDSLDVESSGIDFDPNTPAVLELIAQNPSSDRVVMRLELPVPASVAIEIFDAGGRRLWTREPEDMVSGRHLLHWEGRSDSGEDVGAGIFWVRVLAGGDRLTKKIVRVP